MSDPEGLRAEAERLLEEAEQPHRDAHDGNWDVSCSACVAELALETQAKSLVRALLAALTAKDEELRSLREMALCKECTNIRNTVLHGEHVATIIYDRETGAVRLEKPHGAPAATSQEKP